MDFVYFDVLYDYFLHPCGLHLVMDQWKEKWTELAHYTPSANNMSVICAKFQSINTNLWLVDYTISTCCEKCEVPTTSSQKMSLKAAKFPP